MIWSDQSPGSGRFSPSSCAWSCKVKAAETGVCDVEGNCLCSGEREDAENIFEYSPDDEDNSGENGVGVGIVY